jgi:hypothetical protein
MGVCWPRAGAHDEPEMDDAVEEAMGRTRVPSDEADAFLASLDTGDVLLAHTRSSFGKQSRRLGGLTFDHVALVVRQRGSRDGAGMVPYTDGDGTYSPMEVRLRPGRGGRGDGEKGKEKEKEKEKHADDWFQSSGRAVGRSLTPLLSRQDGQLQLLDTSSRGTFVYPLVERLARRVHVDNYVAVRRLRLAGGGLTDAQRDALEAWVRECHGRPYESGVSGGLEVARSVLRSPEARAKDKGDERLERLFCSESVAESLQRLGVLDEATLNSNELGPEAFVPPAVRDSEHADDVSRFMVDGASLGPGRLLAWPASGFSTGVLVPLAERVVGPRK